MNNPQDTPHLLQARLTWVQMYQQTGNAGLTCRRCGISRPTLRPSNVDDVLRGCILTLRRERNLGPKRIQAELLRHDQIKRSTSTIWKVLYRASVGPLCRPPRTRQPKRYSRPIPGERVQIDSMKVASGLYPFTAIDDCTRLRVLGLYPDRSAESAKRFLVDRVLEELPFPLQRVQTDQGAEFCSVAFHSALHARRIKFTCVDLRFRQTRPHAPHLNGKVERSQLTDKIEFYALADVEDASFKDAAFKDASFKDAALAEGLKQWQRFYNKDRPHSALGGKTPQERYEELAGKVPTTYEIAQQYDVEKERWNVRPQKRRWVLRL